MVQKELESITEEECIDYVFNLVLNRTFDGYVRERDTVYGQLEKAIGVTIEPAPDYIDRGYNVDFLIKVNDKFMGLQIKPVGNVYNIPQIFKEKSQQLETHKKFEQKFGGKVFYVYSVKKIIQDKEKVISDIQTEIARLAQNN